MSGATICDYCGRRITQNQEPCVTASVRGLFRGQSETPLKLDLHNTCWERWRKELKNGD